MSRISCTSLACVILLLAACGAPEPPASSQAPDAAPGAVATDPEPAPEVELPDNPTAEDLLPDEFGWIWEPWTGDYDGIIERRVLRVLTPYGGYQFYYQGGRPRGATYEMLVRLEAWINEELGRRNIRVYVVPIPVSRDHLISGLLDGTGDLVATDLTVTPEREAQVAFTRPLLTDIREVIVLGPTAPDIGVMDDLAGREIFVRPTSSYAEHLGILADEFETRGLEPPSIVPADEILEAEDVLDMLQAGAAEITVMDEYKAEFWAGVMEGIDVRSDLVVAEGSRIAWAHRKGDTGLAAMLEQFLRENGKGSAFGNDVYKRYLKRPDRARCDGNTRADARADALIPLFRTYGERFDIDWLRLAAQGYQESGLRQNRKSPVGALGIMQVKPTTAADPQIGINDISTPENNIHAGAKYMRFLIDRYFDDDGIHELDQWLFALAAYNAGPAKINRYRREAAEKGYDPNAWFDQVEIIAARRIGRETVTYVSNIYKYYLGYEMVVGLDGTTLERYGDVLTFCDD